MGGGGCSNHPIRDFFSDLFGGSRGGGCGYHPGPSETELHAKKIANELAEMKEKYRESSEKDEKKIIDNLSLSMDNFLNELSEYNEKSYGGKALRINIEGIKQKNETLKKQVIGCIAGVIDERLVQTDKELSVILEERDDKKRAKNFDNFCDKIVREAIRKLVNRIENVVKSQENMVRREIENRLKEVNQNMESSLKSYMDIVDIKEKDESKMEEEEIKYLFKYELATIILDELERGE